MNDLLLQEFLVFDKNSNIENLKLSKKEREVVFLILKGYRNRKIGEILYISENTVKKHIYNIFNKIGINSRFELLCIVRLHNNTNYIEKAC